MVYCAQVLIPATEIRPLTAGAGSSVPATQHNDWIDNFAGRLAYLDGGKFQAIAQVMSRFAYDGRGPGRMGRLNTGTNEPGT
jgi:hypothetical protein